MSFSVNSVELVQFARHQRDFVRDDRPQVAFAGRSNVGKSSLINRLLGRRSIARTSSTPGRTRGVLYYLVNDRFYFVDLPGYGYARVSKTERATWSRFVDSYLRSALDRTILVLLVDAKVAGTPLDTQASEYLQGLGASLVVAVTKIDRIPRNKRSRCLADVAERLDLSDRIPLVPVSAKTGDGIEALWKVVGSRPR